jgi:threonine-phosphate decarboxylase
MSHPEQYPLHGGQLHQIATRFGIPVSHLLDFSANINPDGPPPAVISSIRESLDTLSTLTNYPDLQEVKLKKSIARYAGVPVENIVVSNGFVALLEATLRALPIRRCLVPVTAFVEYRKTLERNEVETSTYRLSSDSCFSYDPVAMLAGQHDAILLANPQNPSGICHDAASIRDLIGAASARNIYVLLDEAFIDYIPEHSLTAATNEFSNLIVFRSVTKFFGIPGLRVAYTVATPKLSSMIGENVSPWAITTLASIAVNAALGDLPYAIDSRSRNTERRIALQRQIESLGLVAYPSAANFILFQLPPTVDPNAFWQHMIRRHGIVLRACANYAGLSEGHFRTAIRTPMENDKLVTAIAESLSSLNATEQP